METTKMKLQKIGGCGGEGGGAILTPPSNHSRRGSSGRPSWLLFTIADFDERMKMLAVNVSEEDSADSFAKRAEEYYQKRPQLLALLQELYNGYVALADRYCQALAKNNHHRRRYSSPISPFNFNENDQFDEEDAGDVIDSDDAASSLSYQTPFPAAAAALDPDMIVADLVMKSVDCDLILNELIAMERKSGESSRKIELQKSLLDVLESERLILLNENASLVYRVNALLEENKGLTSESLFMKRKAADLARCVLKLREDHRVCMLSRKIEDLQGQICGLEKKNKDYYDQLVKHEEEKKSKAITVKTNSKSPAEVTLEDCFHVNEDVSCFGSLANMKKGCLPTNGSINRGRRASRLWNRVKKIDFFLCVPHVNST
nr:kinase-interacting family protein-like [Coffea arabica]